MAITLDGRMVAATIKQQVKEEVAKMERPPMLAIVVVGDNPASERYVRNKVKDCHEVGIECEVMRFGEARGEVAFLTWLRTLASIESIDGIIVQLPLPAAWNQTGFLHCIPPEKDVDGLTPYNVGMTRIYPRSCGGPCTPEGVIRLLEAYRLSPAYKTCAIIGRSSLVGMPLAAMMTARGATTTVCHTKTRDLARHCREADILVSAAGKRGLVTADMVKTGAIVIDVGINFDENGKLCGDVCFDEVYKKASFITPVPGGIGPMTRALLLESVLHLARENR